METCWQGGPAQRMGLWGGGDGSPPEPLPHGTPLIGHWHHGLHQAPPAPAATLRWAAAAASRRTLVPRETRRNGTSRHIPREQEGPRAAHTGGCTHQGPGPRLLVAPGGQRRGERSHQSWLCCEPRCGQCGGTIAATIPRATPAPQPAPQHGTSHSAPQQGCPPYPPVLTVQPVTVALPAERSEYAAFCRTPARHH